jgi:GNAT superfamily N-acetyltransferase
MSDKAVIRPSRAEDGDGLSRLIARCWADYPGSVYDRHGEMAPLDDIQAYYEAMGGIHWSVIRDDRIVGCLGAAPIESEVGQAWEMTKMYVTPLQRRSGFARLLVGLAEEHAAERGADQMILWTDTRFQTAHRFYEHLGYQTDNRTRAIDDLSRSVEYFYSKRLEPVL